MSKESLLNHKFTIEIESCRIDTETNRLLYKVKGIDLEIEESMLQLLNGYNEDDLKADVERDTRNTMKRLFTLTKEELNILFSSENISDVLRTYNTEYIKFRLELFNLSEGDICVDSTGTYWYLIKVSDLFADIIQVKGDYVGKLVKDSSVSDFKKVVDFKSLLTDYLNKDSLECQGEQECTDL